MIKIWVIECTSTKKFNPLARLIMAFQKIDFSHVALLIEDTETKEKATFEAVWPKAKESTYEEFLVRYKVIRAYRLSPPSHCHDWEVREFARSLVQKNEHYSIAQLVAIQIQNSFTNLKNILGKMILNHKKGMICSEFIALVLSKGWGVMFDEQFDTIDLEEVVTQARSLAGE